MTDYWKLLAVFVFIRFVYALSARSSLHPDEHWQGPEVAYRMVFGSTETTWEWLDTVALRSHLHPLMFAIFYKVLDLLRLDNPWVVAYGPRYVQALLTAIGDLSFYLIGKKLYGSTQAIYGVTFYLTCWFSVSTFSRTTSNAAEAALTLIGLCFLTYNRPVLTAGSAAICFLMRPPSAVLWLPICISIAFKFPYRVTLKCLVFAMGLIGGVCCMDRFFYGVPAGWFAAWNFLKFNILLGVAEQYGTDPWYYYCVWVYWLFMISLPCVLLGLPSLPKPWVVGILTSFLVLSVSPHKELRFISTVNAVGSLAAIPWLSRRVILLGVLYHAWTSVYANRWKNVAAETVVNSLRAAIKDEESVFFLSCHQNPLRFFLHGKRIGVDWVDCSPLPVRATEKSENERFFDDSISFLNDTERGRKATGSEWLVTQRRDQNGDGHFALLSYLKEKHRFDTYGEIVHDNSCSVGDSPDLCHDGYVLLRKQ